ncbi:MAG: ABC transporter substrate-binding protein, partial [Thaumarchaeota archaeon]|nr:ABC transporter substrate-binding protein [Nitrososphaerota archaeon]
MKQLRRLVIYGSLGLRPGLSELLWAFRKNNRLEEFPVYLDDHPFQIYERILAERKHGMRSADIVLMPHYMVLRMEKEGLLAPRESKESHAYPAKFQSRKSLWYAAATTFMSMVFDSTKLTHSDAPSTLEDLMEPPFAGRLGLQSLTASKAGNLGVHYIAYLKSVVGQKRWNAFIRSLAGRNRPKSYDCIDHLLQGLLAGEHLLSLTVYSLAYFREKMNGSAVSLLSMEDAPQMFTFTSVGITKTGGKSESAGRFVDFLLGKQGQSLVGAIPGLSPARPGIKPSYQTEVEPPEVGDFHPNETDLKSAAEAAKTFAKLGLP